MPPSAHACGRACATRRTQWNDLDRSQIEVAEVGRQMRGGRAVGVLSGVPTVWTVQIGWKLVDRSQRQKDQALASSGWV